MEKNAQYRRPPFEEAAKAWQSVLADCGLPTDLVWIFEENLCLERDQALPGGFRVSYQTRFTPPPSNAHQVAYDHFCEFEAPLVWYRLGSNRGKSICLLLCDDWFRTKTETEGFMQRPEWRMAFRPGQAGEIEEVEDRQRWENRLLRDRPVRELDFGMTLRAVHEVLAHGRVLTAYERYALKLLHVWRHWVSSEG